MKFRYRVQYWNSYRESAGGMFVDLNTEIPDKGTLEEAVEAVSSLEVRIAQTHGFDPIHIDILDYRFIGQVPDKA